MAKKKIVNLRKRRFIAKEVYDTASMYVAGSLSEYEDGTPAHYGMEFTLTDVNGNTFSFTRWASNQAELKDAVADLDGIVNDLIHLGRAAMASASSLPPAKPAPKAKSRAKAAPKAQARGGRGNG